MGQGEEGTVCWATGHGGRNTVEFVAEHLHGNILSLVDSPANSEAVGPSVPDAAQHCSVARARWLWGCRLNLKRRSTMAHFRLGAGG